MLKSESAVLADVEFSIIYRYYPLIHEVQQTAYLICIACAQGQKLNETL